MQARLRERILQTHIDDVVIPQIPFQAGRMAREFLTFIDLLIPRTCGDLVDVPKLDVVALPNTDPMVPIASLRAETDRQPNTAPLDFYEIPPARTVFRTELTKIFEKALKWRAEKHKFMHESWLFHFPGFGQPYKTEEVQRLERSHGTKEPWKGVILCLMPIVYRNRRKIVQGLFDEYRIVSRGIVL